MPTLLRTLSAAVGAAFAVTVDLGAEDALPKSSPFVPATTSVSAPSAVNENYELAAISTIGKKTTVNVYDKAAKKGRWIVVGETVDGIKVLNFDPRLEQVVVRVGSGSEKVLSLRRATASAAPSTSGPVKAPWAPPPGFAAAPTVPPAGASEPVAIAPATPVAVNQAPPPPPGSIAHQEQEARMLVSDLLEIGMAQRKAYEEAEKKAAEAALAAAQTQPQVAPASAPAAKP